MSTAAAMRPMTVTVHRLPAAGGVEVHDVEPRRAIGREPSGLTDGVVPVVGRPVVVALVEPDAASTEEVDGGVEVHRRGDRGSWPGSAGPPARTSRGGTAWPRRCRAPRRPRRHRRSRTWRRPRARPRGRTSARSTPRSGRPHPPTSPARRGPGGCSTASAGASRRRGDGGRFREARRGRPRRDPPRRRHTGAACRRRCRGTGDPTRRPCGSARPGPSFWSAPMQAPKAPTPGSTTPAASAIRPASAVRRASAPRCSSAFWAERRLPMP